MFSALRVYALSKIWPLAALVLILSVAPSIVKFVSTSYPHATQVYGVSQIPFSDIR